MLTTANLGLIAWDREQDDFEHSQLANNWVRLDAHDHLGTIAGAVFSNGELTAGTWTATGKGLPIQTGAILPEAIERYLVKQRAIGHKQIGLAEIWSENIKSEAVENAHIKNLTITGGKVAAATLTIDKLDPNIIGLGHVALWYRPPGSGNEPGSIWHICDGTAWAAIAGNKMGSGESELKTGSIPDLRNAFARGADLAHIGESGGSATVSLAHSHTVNSHSHSVNNHQHGISTDGGHNHGFDVADGEGTGFSLVQHVVQAHTSPVAQNEALALYLNQVSSAGTAFMQTHGAHAHGGATAATAPGTSAVAPGTDSQLGTVSTTPPFFGLCYVMRVR